MCRRLRQRPLWIRLIIEFLGTFVLVTVAAGEKAAAEDCDVPALTRIVTASAAITSAPDPCRRRPSPPVAPPTPVSSGMPEARL